jgi:ATP-dependent protease ClpP protease subunit
LTEEIGADMLLSALETLKTYPDGATVPVLIDSPGGAVIPTLLFLDMVRIEKEKKHLTLECTSGLLVMSAAAAIYEGMCDIRHSRPETLWLFHEMSGTVRGKADEIEDELAFSRALEHSLAVIVAPKLRMTPEQYLAWIKGRDRFLTTDQMKAMGGCDA